MHRKFIRKTLASASDDVLLTGVQRILLTIAVCAGMRAAQTEGERLGRNRALCKVRDHLGDVSYVASRMVKEVVDALQWDVTEEVRKPAPPPKPEMDAVKCLVGALRRLDRDWYESGYDSSLSLRDVLEVK